MSAPTRSETTMPQVKVGDRISFTPKAAGHRWWTVEACDDRFIIATQQAPFRPKGELFYTIVDLTGYTHAHNGVRPGVIRSSSDMLGGGWDEGWPELLAALQSGEVRLSTRRHAPVDHITVGGAR